MMTTNMEYDLETGKLFNKPTTFQLKMGAKDPNIIAEARFDLDKYD